MTTNNADRERAQRLLRHYFRMIAEAAGVRWDSDNDGEVSDIADHLIAAAVAEMQATAQPAPGFAQPSMFPNGEDSPLFTMADDADDHHLNCVNCNRHPAEAGRARWATCWHCKRPVCENCAWETHGVTYCCEKCLIEAN